jgi:glutamate N-acetyltransferase/amino-acid N-acetyltransferase
VYFESLPHAERYFTPGKNDEIGGARKVMVFDHGVPLDFDENLAKEILSEEAVRILVTMEDGTAEGRAWGCDLTYDYVKINGDYRT